jgi:hypothetical protein
MSQQWDFTGYDRYGQLVLAVGVKNQPDISPEGAAFYRGNLLLHSDLPNPDFLLLVFPDKLYLWKNIETRSDEIAPTYTIDARSFFNPYFERLDLQDGRVFRGTFEFIVGSWLRRFFWPEFYENGIQGDNTDHQWLIETGLADVINGGRLEFSKEPA